MLLNGAWFELAPESVDGPNAYNGVSCLVHESEVNFIRVACGAVVALGPDGAIALGPAS